MDATTGDWRAAVGRVLPDDEELIRAVADALGEDAEGVRPSVLIGSIVRGVAASPDELETVIDRERARIRAGTASRARARGPRLRAGTLEELLADARRLAATDRLDLSAVIEIQRASGAIAARAGMRLVLFLARYGVIRRLTWERCVTETQAGRLDAAVLGDLGRWIFLWNEVTLLAVTDGYRAAEREILARDVQARRGALEEILGVIPDDVAATARLRRVATRFGLDPDRTHRLVVVAPRPEADPTPDSPGFDHDDLELLAGRIGHLLGAAPAGAEGAGAGVQLPAVLPMRGRIVILSGDDRAGLARIPAALDSVLGGQGRARREATGRAGPGARAEPSAAWVAIGSLPVEGVAGLAGALADLADAARTAERVGLRGWVAEPGRLAVERLLLASRDLGDDAVRAELGPLLADERMGDELVETLQVYFDAGENMREAARRLHLANRTVAYRLEKIEALLGGPLDDASRRRLAVALLVRRLRGAAG